MIEPILLTLKLALITVPILLILALPIGWWLAKSQGLWKEVISAIVTLPLILPSTILGFYLLLLLGRDGVGGTIAGLWGGTSLAFTFSGLVIGSIIYSLPFAVQPIRLGFEAIGKIPFEAAATLQATAWQGFWLVAVPLNRRAIITAALLAMAHTIGEFGVVLMIGGNIPGATQVLSLTIYDAVESMNWREAHQIAAGLMVFSFVISLTVGILQRNIRGNK